MAGTVSNGQMLPGGDFQAKTVMRATLERTKRALQQTRYIKLIGSIST